MKRFLKISKFKLPQLKNIFFGNFLVCLFSVFLILIFISLTTFSMVTYYSSSHLLRSELENSQEILLSQARVVLDKQIRHLNDLATQLSNNSDVKSLYYMSSDKKPADHLKIYDLLMNLKYLKSSTDSVENIAIFFTESNSVCSIYGSHPIEYYFQGISNYNTPEIKEFVNSNTYKNFQYISTSEIDHDFGSQKVVTFGVTLPIQSSMPQAVLLVDMQEESIRELINSIDKDIPACIAILDGKDRLMTMYQNLFPENQVFRLFFSEDISELLQDPPETVMVEGVNYDFFVKLEGAFQYVSLIPQSYISDKIQFIAWINIVSVVTVLCIAAVFSYRIAARFYSPIREMLSFIHLNQRQGRLSGTVRGELEFINGMLRYIYQQNDKLNRSLQEGKQIVTERIKLDLLNGSSTNLALYEGSQFMVQYPFQRFQVAVIGIERIRGQYLQDDPVREQVLEILDGFSERLRQQGVLFDVIRRHAVSAFPVILNFDPSDISTTLISQGFEEIIVQLTENFDLFVTIGVGKSCESLSELRQSYIEALASLNRKDVMGQNQTIYIDELDGNSLYQGIVYSLGDERTLINLIKLGDFTQAQNFVDQILKSNRNLIYQPLYNELFLLLCNSCRRALIDLGFSAEEISLPNALREIRNTDLPEEKRKIFMEILKESAVMAKDVHENKNNRIFKQAVEFIQEHYQENISLQILEEHIGVSASYISHIFSQNSRESFLDYLNHYRIERAMELLSTTEKTVQEVAVLCGIPSTNSFNRIFKKYTGTTPGKYRNL